MMNLNELNLDILKEVCNIASGRALASLIDLTGLKIERSSTDVRLEDFRNIPAIFGSEDSIIAATSQDSFGDLKSSIFVGFDERSVNILLDAINEKFSLPSTEFDFYNMTEVHLSTISEIGGILTGSYIGAIANFIKAEISLNVPTIAVDMSAAIISQVLSTSLHEDDKILLISTDFTINGELINIKIILLPEEGALNFLISSIKRYYLEIE